MSEAITYPIRKYDANGNETYYENSEGIWIKREYDANDNLTYFEDSYSNCANGKMTYCENSSGIYTTDELKSRNASQQTNITLDYLLIG
jgi:hypothetical protein